MGFEDAGEVAEVAEAELVADFADGVLVVFEELGGFLHSLGLVVFEEALAEGLFEEFAEFGLAHVGLLCESAYVWRLGEVGLEVVLMA